MSVWWRRSSRVIDILVVVVRFVRVSVSRDGRDEDDVWDGGRHVHAMFNPREVVALVDPADLDGEGREEARRRLGGGPASYRGVGVDDVELDERARRQHAVQRVPKVVLGRDVADPPSIGSVVRHRTSMTRHVDEAEHVAHREHERELGARSGVDNQVVLIDRRHRQQQRPLPLGRVRLGVVRRELLRRVADAQRRPPEPLEVSDELGGGLARVEFDVEPTMVPRYFSRRPRRRRRRRRSQAVFERPQRPCPRVGRAVAPRDSHLDLRREVRRAGPAHLAASRRSR
mmetsp:Transcript_15315/g.61618  ORF Transcript_15315/g.61618 Transcript_15315/m.61618 type:complete len:286 (+) Transcript_15315:446-1303(+)